MKTFICVGGLNLFLFFRSALLSFVALLSVPFQVDRHLHFIFYQLPVGNAVSLPCPIICLYNSQVNYFLDTSWKQPNFSVICPCCFRVRVVQKCVVYGYSSTKEKKGRRKCVVHTFQLTSGTILLCEQAKDDTVSPLAEM